MIPTRVAFNPIDQHISFELHDVDPALDAVLEQCFWQHDDRVWHRSHPRCAPHLAAAMERFAEHAEEMFLQLAYLRPVRWEDAPTRQRWSMPSPTSRSSPSSTPAVG